jgi:hypothetical protein
MKEEDISLFTLHSVCSHARYSRSVWTRRAGWGKGSCESFGNLAQLAEALLQVGVSL